MPTAHLHDAEKPDMTSMIDVVFLMIVFFLCLDFKVLEAKLDAFLPTARGGSAKHVEPVHHVEVAVHVIDPGRREATEADRYALRDRRVRWQVGSRSFATLAECRRELSRLAAEPSFTVPDDATGSRKLVPCDVRGHRATCYDDIARTVDACRAAGFDDIHFGN